MKYTEKKFRLTGISPLLGSIAMNKEVFEDYLVRRKVKGDEQLQRGLEDVENVIEPDVDEKDAPKATGFYRDASTNNIILKDYQIKGFLKEAARALKSQVGITNHVSKIDNLVFIKERNIPLMRGGEWMSNPDSVLDRPLRAMTAQGPRVAKAYSEMVDDPWYIEITIRVIDNAESGKSKAMTMDVVEELLAYGEMKGLLQWRNGGYGSFTFEEIK